MYNTLLILLSSLKNPIFILMKYRLLIIYVAYLSHAMWLPHHVFLSFICITKILILILLHLQT